MARNYKFFFDKSGTPHARGPIAEKTLMTFLELDVQGSDHICRQLMDDLTAIEDESDDFREFIGNAHRIQFTPESVSIVGNSPSDDTLAKDVSAANPIDSEPVQSVSDEPAHPNMPAFDVGLKRFREVLEDWEAFILDDQIDDSLSEDNYQ